MENLKVSGRETTQWTECEFVRNRFYNFLGGAEYYVAAEPPVRCGESHHSGQTEPPYY